jgi:hypothetical protein
MKRIAKGVGLLMLTARSTEHLYAITECLKRHETLVLASKRLNHCRWRAIIEQ